MATVDRSNQKVFKGGLPRTQGGSLRAELIRKRVETEEVGTRRRPGCGGCRGRRITK